MACISSNQIKAARALLSWSQDDLARATELSVSTIRNLEAGSLSPRGKTYEVLRSAIECAGVEFIDPEGVRRRNDEVRIFQGDDASQMLFADMLFTLRQNKGPALLISPTQKALVEMCGGVAKNLEILEDLSDQTAVKCILTDSEAEIDSVRGFSFRLMPRRFVDLMPGFTYGDKQALVLPMGVNAYRFVVIQSRVLALSNAKYFESLWNLAMPYGSSAVERVCSVVA